MGTNDLIQYLLAVDRVDPRVAALYEPLHPAVLRTIAGIVPRPRPPTACRCRSAARWRPTRCTPLVLVGLGVRELSMSPAAIPRVKAALRAVSRRRRARRPRGVPVAAHRRRDRGYASPRAGRGAWPRRAATSKESECAEIPKRVEKPWGYELWWARTDRYVGKILHLRKGESLSLQYHSVKDETIMLQSGRLLFETRRRGRGRRAAQGRDEARATSSTSRPARCTA